MLVLYFADAPIKFIDARFCPIIASDDGRHISVCMQSMS
jgi:hypothetical protein